MKIAVLFQGDLNTVSQGGIAEYVKNLIRFRGSNEVTLVGACRSGEYALGKPVVREVLGSGYTFVPIVDDAGKGPLSFRYVRALRRFRRQLDGFDAIYCQRAEYCLALDAHEVQGRLFQIIHGSSAYTVRDLNGLLSRAYLRAERSAIEKCVRTLVIMKRGDVGMGYYEGLYPGMADRLVYGKIPVDTDVFHSADRPGLREKYGIGADRFVVTYAGRVEDYPKRVSLFPEIVSRVKDLDPLLLVVGDGSTLPVLREGVARLGLDDFFLFAGYCNDRRKLSEYTALADMTLNISSFEGTCTSSLESIACGTPVLSTDAGDIRVFVNGGRNGLVIPNEGDGQIVSDAAESIRRIHDAPVPMSEDYRAYSCQSVFQGLFALFSENLELRGGAE